MHVGLNLIFLVPGETGGMEVAARELIPALVRAAPDVRFTAFVAREGAAANDAPWMGLVEAVTVPVNSTNRLEWVRGEQTLLPRLASRHGVQLLHSLASTAPAWGRFRRVVTVHDLIYARFPEAHGGLRARGMRVLVPLAVRRSDRVIAVSQSTSGDLTELLHTPTAKIDVVPQGLGALRTAQPVDARIIRERFQLDARQVLLGLSAKRPHKNLLALIRALARISPDRRPVLVLPGYPTWHEAELRAQAKAVGVEADIRLEGWLSSEELEGLWDVADAFVYPSLYEGFGLPVLEAMARGVPVACSDASSLPEVVGEAALLFDPYDEDSIASSIERLLGDRAEHERMRASGLERSRMFTWERTARLTLESYGRALA
ncbi:MAG TPA: glycosyltransferase family 1 protein [Solirubrobacteraceae bacterium]|jgi:glycosyltransferase involved in cell wall biosynthesis